MNEVQLPEQHISANPSLHPAYAHPYADPATAEYHSDVRVLSHPHKRLHLMPHPTTERHPHDRLAMWGRGSHLGGAFQGSVGTEFLDHFATQSQPGPLQRPETAAYNHANARLGHSGQREMHTHPNASPHATATYSFDAHNLVHMVPASISTNLEMYRFTAGSDTPHQTHAQRMPPASGSRF